MNYRKTNSLLFGLILTPLSIFAQEVEDYPTATVTEDLCISIDTESAISEFYKIDFSHLHLLSEKEANDKFGFISNNLLTYTVNFSTETAYLQIHMDRTPATEDLAWWNAYINSLCRQ